MRKGIDSVNPLLKNLSIFQYSSHTHTHIRFWCARFLPTKVTWYARLHSIQKSKEEEGKMNRNQKRKMGRKKCYVSHTFFNQYIT